MKTEQEKLRQEFYAADLKYEYHRQEMAKYAEQKERIWKKVLANDSKMELDDIVKVGNGH